MSSNNQLIPIDDKSLLDIYQTQEDKLGTDLLAMSDFFEICIDKARSKVELNYEWDSIFDAKSLIGEIASAIKGGIDISKIGVLVADQSHFSKDVVDGLKSGIYHIGESKEVSGNLRPAIVDGNNRLVKFFTLKRAFDPTAVLSDLTTISMQLSLQQISSELQSISNQIEYSIDLARRTELSNKFINAREYVKKAFNNPNHREEFLIQADGYLTEGLTALYSDLDAELNRLSGHVSIKGKIQEVDTILSHINEDMLMIPKYVAVQVYLLNYSGRYDDAANVINTYKYQIEGKAKSKVYNDRFSAVELIHEMYPYRNDNRDFWLNMPSKATKALEPLTDMIEQKGSDIILIEESNDEYIEDNTEDYNDE